LVAPHQIHNQSTNNTNAHVIQHFHATFVRTSKLWFTFQWILWVNWWWFWAMWWEDKADCKLNRWHFDWRGFTF